MVLTNGSNGNGAQQQRDAPPGNSQSSSSKATVDESHTQAQQLLVAGLHRDGEQARIVEVIRRRQMQKYDENYFTFEYMWGSVLYYSGFADEHPLRAQQLNDTKLDDDGDETESERLQINSTNTTDEQKSSSTPQPTMNEGQLRERAFSERIARRHLIVRLTFTCYRRIHLMLRWFIDICITRLSQLEFLPRSPSMYATNPTYSLQFGVDDIICFIAILWLSLWISSRTSHVVALTIIMFCIVMGSVGTRVVGRVGLTGQQLQSHSSTNSDSTRSQSAPVIKPTLSATNQNEESSKSIERLQKRHPNATEAECIRFFRCTKRNEKAASARIEEWFAWRQENGLITSLDAAARGAIQESIPYDQDYMKADEMMWNETAAMAIEIMSKSAGSDNGAGNGVLRLPQIICSYEMHHSTDALGDDEVSQTAKPPRCKDGSRIFHLVPARFDLSIATAQVYALAAALYLDRLLSRSTTEKVSLICDVRGGRGWANPTPWSLLPFVQATSSLLGRHFPERLKRMVLYPMPSSAVWVWAAAQKFLDADTASKVVVVGLDGTSTNNNNGMHKELKKFITENDYRLLEERRRSFFARKN